MRRNLLILTFCFTYVFAAFSSLCPASAASSNTGYSKQAEKILPAVVSVFVAGDALVSEDERLLPPLQNNLVGKLPDDFLANISALGSGFIVSKDGDVLTNAHVVDNADEIMVMLNDGKVYAAKLTGKDAETDIALLKIQNAPSLKAVTFGDSDKTRVGDIVLAVGNPYGLGNSLSSGIVSARFRDMYIGAYDDFLQTDVAINKGSSGGPLFNDKTELIGLNTAILSQDGNASGISFAIPSKTVNSVYKELKSYGKVKRGKIGVKVQPLSNEFARFLGLNSTAGALISSVEPDGSAARIGIEAGDVILKFGGAKIENMRQFPKLVSSAQVGSLVEIVLWCEGQEITLKIKIEEMDSSETVRNRSNILHLDDDAYED